MSKCPQTFDDDDFEIEQKRPSPKVMERCARELHSVAREDGQCRCGIFWVGKKGH